MLHICQMRKIVLLLLLFFSSEPLRRMPMIYAAWPTTSFELNSQTGNSLPKFSSREMAKEQKEQQEQQEQQQQPIEREFFDMTMAGHFPNAESNLALPPYLKRRWRLLHQRYDKSFKKLQVHQMWVDLQSPANWQDQEHKGRDLESNNFWKSNKRTPIQWPRTPTLDQPVGVPRYPYAIVWPNEQQTSHTFKREPVLQKEHQVYLPTISAGVMTNLGDFFNDLKANVLFAEQSQQLGEAESQLLEGVHQHPLRAAKFKQDEQSQQDDELTQQDDLKTAKLLQAIRSYRPSQKIRSLVSRNPDGYRNSQFIDPSYMWLGLGK